MPSAADVRGAGRNSPDEREVRGSRLAVLYDWLLPWLIGRPLPTDDELRTGADTNDDGVADNSAAAAADAAAAATVARNGAGEDAATRSEGDAWRDDWHSTQRSNAHDYRAVLHACAHVVRRRGLSLGATKQVVLFPCSILYLSRLVFGVAFLVVRRRKTVSSAGHARPQGAATRTV